MTKNYVFREFICNLSREETAKLCFKSVMEVKRWDKGKPIPKECKRLMRMHKGLEISHSKEWEGFSMQNNMLRLPNGQLLSPQQILIGAGLLEIQSELEVKTSTHLVKLARAISNIKTG
ncbi:regulator [Vibrio olivae]|uniref:Regulator n=1 Tax=Vibrio olivae TaxID=1243002 RepID=A0ABV5HRN0_9VIBR